MDWKKKCEDISFGELAIFGSGFVYISGYLISALYVRSRGINQMSLVSAQYIETGLVFALLTALFIVVPLIILKMALDSRKRHGHPTLLTSLVFPIVTSNYLYVFTFFCLFVTRYEWLLRFRFLGVETGLIGCFGVYTGVVFVLQILFMYMKYDAKKSGKGISLDLENADQRQVMTTPVRRWLGKVIIAALLVATAMFDYVLLSQVGWFPAFLSRASAYLFCIILIVCIAFVVERLSHVYSDKPKRWQLWCVAGPFFLALYYFAISSYEFGVYINIPMSRGGRYPVTKTTLFFRPDSTHAKNGQLQRTSYVIEETSDHYYVIGTDVSNWFHDHPPVDGISKAEVSYPHYDHLRSGEPRINHLRLNKSGQQGAKADRP
ncbi:MAG: hypothetical protein C4576_33670 [Desulfobacteraceae bacterium]|nr:MAG: hypothetical protein C4576_33670 [Desulfobacteraceae bacterium]